ncbi:MAG: cob(I)yrinic acid a,c-diamide adenosyltransferase [Xanthomonadaceae bacterium]|nr:cob(I)yrinic acid a,c-diamide adenosyltransferase [Xanthomonadaceae bacterium]
MGNRLSKIYTRTGDQGDTGLGDGARVRKDHARVEAFGTVDELNSALGLLLTHELPEDVRACLLEVQHRLFDLGGELSIPGHLILKEASVTELEQTLDTLNGALAPLQEFILPGGTAAAAVCHLARAVCRRAERRVISLARDEEVNPVAIRYLNRLSDLLFVMARHLNRVAGVADVLWRHERRS